MRVLLFLLFTLAVCFNYTIAQPQTPVAEKISVQDSVLLSKSMLSFMNAIEQGDSVYIKANTLNKVSCTICDWKTNDGRPPSDYFVSVDDFIKQICRKSSCRPLLDAYYKRGSSYKLSMHNDMPIDGLRQGVGEQRLYHSSIQTIPPNNKAFGNGMTHDIIFIKQDGEFKLYGISSSM